jgi:NAD(P)-dependent dehydrogenase (short-subunit alcohol dehydrogenase family)
MKLNGKCAIITGANQGLGYEIAKQFILEGAHVMLCARNVELLNKTFNELSVFNRNKNQILIQQTDVSNPQQVELLVKTAIEKLGGLDIVVANAGVYGTKGPLEEIDWTEWSDAIDINLKGTVLLCKLALPHLKKQRAGKILIVAGGGATKPMPFMSAYAASKAAVVRFGETLAEEVKDFGIDVNMVAPGALNTRLLDEILSAGPDKVGKGFYQQSLKQKASGGTSPEVGANLCVFLSSSESDGVTGKLISAVWDPWKDLPNYLSDLKNTDIYTLRRIIPKDRGKEWGDVE